MSSEVVIVGAGPAGLMLAYSLVTNGIPVRVVERHPDFAREFRGEYLQSSVFAILDELGLLPELVRREEAIPNAERRMFLGLKRRIRLPGGSEPGAFVLQEGLLGLLHAQCSLHRHYRLDFATTALSLVSEGERVVGVKVRRDDGEEIVRGGLVVVTNGRNSALRSASGLGVEAFTVPADTLWLRFDFSDVPDVLPDTLDVHMHGRGVVAVFHRTTRNRLQVAYSAPGDLKALRKDLPALKASLLPTVPAALRAHVERKLDAKTEWQVLRVTVDRLEHWHRPGVLFLGDAAHTMSPSGGQGLNVAIRDAIVAGNHLIRATRENKAIDDTVLAAIEAERRPEIEALQAGQVRAHGMVMKPAPALHVMFSMMGLFLPMIDRKIAAANATRPTVRPEFPVPIRSA